MIILLHIPPIFIWKHGLVPFDQFLPSGVADFPEGIPPGSVALWALLGSLV